MPPTGTEKPLPGSLSVAGQMRDLKQEMAGTSEEIRTLLPARWTGGGRPRNRRRRHGDWMPCWSAWRRGSRGRAPDGLRPGRIRAAHLARPASRA
jgi:hypothetical protein